MIPVLIVGIVLSVALIWTLLDKSRLGHAFRFTVFAASLAIVAAGTVSIMLRFEGGLGASTNLNDFFPWGLWIAFDLCAVALAAGGFVLAGAVHVFKLKRFEPILKPAVLTSFIAYNTVAAILVLDLGRPYRFWHPLVMWQPHSAMFEITICITLYTTILSLEFSPVIFEKIGWKGAATMIHDVAVPVVIFGVILSTLHQSSFGSLFLIVPEKLSALWYTPVLPILFLISAIPVGLATLIVESYVCKKFLNKHLPHALIVELGHACSKVLWLYFVVKVADFHIRGMWQSVFNEPWLGALLAAETALIVLPALVLARGRTDRASRGLLPAAMAVVVGVVLNRLNICWFGLFPYTGPIYFPSWMEVCSTLMLLWIGMAAFVATTHFLPVFPEPKQDALKTS